MQLIKTARPISLTDSAIFTFLNLLQSPKASCRTAVTPLGISISVRLLQFLKAALSISVTESGIVTLFFGYWTSY